MNRFDKPRQYDYSFDRYMPQLYMPNFEAWGQVIAKTNAQEAAFDELAAKMPQNIETTTREDYFPETGTFGTYTFGDTEMAKKYKEEIEKIKQGLNEAAVAGDATLYKQRLKEGVRFIEKSWAPGGTADYLQKRWEQYGAGLKTIKEAANKDGKYAAVNLPYAIRQFEIGVGTFEEPGQGRYIGEADIYPFVDVQQDAIEFAKKLGISEEQIGKIRQGLGGMYEITESAKGVNPEDIKKIEDFINQQQYRKQLAIQGYNIGRGFESTENLTGAMKQANETLSALRARDQKVRDYIEKTKKGTVSDDETEEVMGILYSKGLFGPNVDLSQGRYNLEEGLANFISQDRRDKYEDFKDPQEFLDFAIKQDIQGMAKSTLPKGYVWDEELDKLWSMDYQYGRNVALEKEKIKIWTPPNAPIVTKSGTTKVTPENQFERQQSAQNAYDLTINSQKDMYKKLYGKYADTHSMDDLDNFAQEAYAASGNGKDYNAFIDYFNRKGIDFNQTQLGGGELWKNLNNAQYSELVKNRKDVTTQRDNEQAIALSMTRQAFDKFVKSEGANSYKQFMAVNKNIFKNQEFGFLDSDKVYNYLFETDYSKLPKEMQSLRNAMFRTMQDKGFFNGVEAEYQPYSGFVPGENTAAAKVYKGISDAIKNPEVLAISKTWQNAQSSWDGFGDLKQTRLLSTDQSADGTWFAVIEAKDNSGNIQIASVPFDEILQNGDERYRTAINQDSFDQVGMQNIDDNVWLLAGNNNFRKFAGAKAIPNRLSTETKIKNLSSEPAPVEYFRFNEPNGAVKEYRIVASRGVNDKVSFTLQVATNKQRTSWQSIPDFTNFNNIDALRSAYSMYIAADDVQAIEYIVRKAKTAGESYTVKPSHHNKARTNK